MKAVIKTTHWKIYGIQHDDRRYMKTSLLFHIVTTITTILMLVSGQ